jgi:hypothetical protein
MGSMIAKCPSYISRKLSPRYFGSYFLFHRLNRDIVRKAFHRSFAVAGDERPEGFAWATDGFLSSPARFVSPKLILQHPQIKIYSKYFSYTSKNELVFTSS